MLDATHEFTRDFSPGIMPGDTNAPPTANGSGVYPIFTTDDEYDERRSAEMGRPYFVSVEKVKFLIPGDRTAAPERLVTEDDKVRFADAYNRFKQSGERAIDGTPLEQWNLLTSGQVATLKWLNIYTVEQLAGIADDKLHDIGIGARQLRKQAQALLETAATGAVPARLVAENEELKGTVGILTQQIEALSVRLEGMARDMGENVTDMSDPVAVAKAAVEQIKGPTIKVPENYKKLGFPRLRELCDVISAAPVTDREGALEIIEEYLTTQA